MRTTVNIDDDIFRIVKEIAKHDDTSLGKVLSELARKGMQANRDIQHQGHLPVFQVSKQSRIITLEDVKKLEDLAT